MTESESDSVPEIVVCGRLLGRALSCKDMTKVEHELMVTWQSSKRVPYLGWF